MRLPINGNPPITQIFGVRKENYQRFLVKYPDGTTHPMEGHNGMDFGVPKGTPIYAPHNGKIIEATFDKDGYGNYVKIENSNEGSVLAHLDSIKVKVDFEVKEGDLIGYSGNTGNSTGAHLHWGLYTMPRDRGNGYSGFVDQMKLYLDLFAGLPIKDSLYKPSNYSTTPAVGGTTMLETKYKVGDEIKVSQDIPVGGSPRAETFDYGKVGNGFPAKVVGIKLDGDIPYYNIDQRYIGGGTGWVNALVVDKAPAEEPFVTPAITAEPEKPKQPQPYFVPTPDDNLVSRNDYLIVIEQVGLVSKERDIAIEEARIAKSENTTLNGIVSGFKALGYANADELKKETTKKDEIILGLQSQIASALNRASTLATELARKDKEDATAIEEAMDVVNQAFQLKDEMSKIAQTVGSKPKLWDIIGAVENIKRSAESAISKARQEMAEAKPSVKVESTQKNSLDWLVSLFK